MPVSHQSLAFVLCVEAGPLEQQAILLASSIRRWAGDYANDEIHAYRPRTGPKLAAETYAALDRLGVVVHEEVLNRDHHHYVHANTLYAMARAEESLDTEIIVWCDSDQLFLSEPSAFDLAPSSVAAGSSPHYQGPAHGPRSTGPGHPLDPYWLQMYELAGVRARPYLKTLIEGMAVRAFWNAGLVVLRRDAGLAHEWISFFRHLLDVGHIPSYGILNVDQLALAAILTRRAGDVEQLSSPYNHNLALRARLPEPERSFELADIVCFHYHVWLNRENFLEDLRPRLSRESERYLWLQEFLPLQPTNRRELPGPPIGRGGRLRRRLRRRRRRAVRRVRRALRRPG